MGRRRRQGDPKLAVGYIRVSTSEQRNSPGAQRDAMKKWCRQNGVTLLGVHQDIGVSGAAKLGERVGFFSAVLEMSQRGAGVLLVAKLDRLARDAGKDVLLTAEVARRGGVIASADGVGNSGGPSGKLFRTMLAAFAEYELEMIRGRTAAALQARRRRGERYTCRARYGERWTACGRFLEANPIEAVAVERIRELRGLSYSLQRITEELQRRSDCPPRGAQWHRTTVYRIVRRLEAEDS